VRVKGQNVLVVGFARSGLASANFLLKRGARVTVTDRKDRAELEDRIARLEGPVELSLGGHRRSDFLQSDWIVLSPGVPSDLPELAAAAGKGIPVYSEVELAYRFLKGTFIGVTGSNGKTTTSTLIGKIFEAAGRPCRVAGNIGVPLVDCIESAPASGEMTYVVEFSSFQLEHIERFRCRLAVVLNVTPDHQDRYAGFDDYVEAKGRIFANQTEEDFAVLNADNPHSRAMAAERRSRVCFFSRLEVLEEGVFAEEGTVYLGWKGRKQPLMRVGELRLKGNHNLENVLAAAAVGLLSEIPPERMAGTFRGFPGVEHRLERVGDVQGVVFYNDSKATNIDSARHALEAFEEPLVVIMGGLDKGADFSALKGPMRERVKKLVLIGQAADKIERSLGDRIGTLRAGRMDEAVHLAFSEAAPGDVVLLSPGCASFDMFEDFEHRGRVFKEAVRELGRSREVQ